jgi:hypothetical protein
MPPKPLDTVERELRESSPLYRFEYVTVTFPTLNQDYDVAHSLNPPDPDEVDYEVVRKDRSCDVYNDQSGTRRTWGAGYITLRCTVSGATVQLRLSIRRT